MVSLLFFEYLGEVIVQRLNIQTLWIHPPPYENARVCGFDWRPDVHVLAVGMYSATTATTKTTKTTKQQPNLHSILDICCMILYLHSSIISVSLTRRL